ncbi:MAG: hypothetical protein SFZ24_02175 [Planctomycetota bacterium]|nr:hypothetical protein [Planctomycetota bacterium]
MDPLDETWQDSAKGASGSAAPGEITLVKGAHTWRFRFEPGEEPAVFACAAAITEQPASGLDHFDLAILAYRLGVQAGFNAHPPAPF